MHVNKKSFVTKKISTLSTYLKEIVYGGNDGIITTFAVVAGFAGAGADVNVLPVVTVLLFGFANLFADGVSMALGDFLSSRSEREVYRNEQRKELLEIHSQPDYEIGETIELLQKKGFSLLQAKQLASIYQTNEAYWLEFMMSQELQLPNTEHQNSIIMSVFTFFSFIGFGLIPLLPYVLLSDHPQVFIFSCIATIVAMLSLGIVRFKVTGQAFIRSIGENVLLGSIAAAVAYIVGMLFHI